jgi:hypothetical protein
MNAPMFLGYLKLMSGSGTRAGPRRCPFHKAPGMREMIEAAGATLLYLPPYSQDLQQT